MHSFICIPCMLTRKLTLSIPPSERQRFADIDHRRIMQEGKSIDRADMALGIFLDGMKTDFPNEVVINEQIEDNLKKDNKQKVVADILPLPHQEQHLPPYQTPAQSNKKLKQKKINHKNNDQEERHPLNDLIPMSYAHFLPILVNAGAIMPKRIQLVWFPYHPKHDPNATFGYHTGYVRHSIDNCNPFKAKV